MRLFQYSNQELFDKIVETIAHGKRKYHGHYDRTVELAKFYNQIMTGDDQDELILKYQRKDEGKQEEQRVKIYNSRTQFASGKITTVYNEVSRSDNVVEVIKYENETPQTKKKLEEISERLMVFQGDQTAIQYTYEAMERLNFYDPNAFIITHFTDFNHLESKTPAVYPIEVYSQQAIRYEYSNGELLYLLFYQEFQLKDLDGNKNPITKTARKYYLFAADVTWEFIELPENMPIELLPGYEQIEIEIVNKEGHHDTKAVKNFQWKQYDTMSKRTPVIRVGYILDPTTRAETCISPLQKAEKLFHDLIWTKSEYDLTKAMHWFYQKFVYAPECEFRIKSEEYGEEHCQSGILSMSHKTCPACEGSGLMVHKSTQDLISIKMPRQAEQIIPLSNLVHYETIDSTIVQELKDDLKSLEVDIFKAVFNSQVFDRSEIAVTATEKNLDMRAMKNALIKFADQVSRVYKFIIEMTAIYTDNDEGLILQHKHDPDFRLESVHQLIAQRREALEAGAPYEVIRKFDVKILSLQHMDDLEMVTMMEAREKFRPFREKSQSERMFILTKLAKADYHHVLWVYFEQIMTEVFFEDKTRGKMPWYKMPYPEQKKIVDEKVEEIQDHIKEEEPPPLLTSRQVLGEPAEPIDPNAEPGEPEPNEPS